MAKKALTVFIDEATIQRLRATVVGMQAQGHEITLAGAADAAITTWCETAEATHHDNQPYPPTARELRAGRPLKERGAS